MNMEFQPSKIDEWLLYRNKIPFLVYADDGITVDKNMSEINNVINELKEAGYNIEDRGNITDYLGINFKYIDKNTLELT